MYEIKNRPRNGAGKRFNMAIYGTTASGYRIHISNDNEKTGIMSFSTLAGDMSTKYGGYVPETRKGEAVKVCGTCAGTCPDCYALRMTRYNAVFDNYRDNTEAVKADPVGTVLAIEQLLFSNPFTAPRVFRFHDSGDFCSLEYFTAVCAMIARHPETIFGSYTKARDIVLSYGVENIPANFSLQCSPWEGVCEPIADLPQFIYDDGTNPELASLPHCPAVDKNGKRTGVMCKDCGRCYRAKRGQKTAVYAH